jgi:cyanophycinase
MSRAHARRAFLLLVLLTVASSTASAAALGASTTPPKGHLVLNGGAGEAEPFWTRIFELAGGKDAAIVILPTASERAETGQEYVEELRVLGATGMRAIELRVREDASRPEFLAAIAAAKVIFFTGGDQSKITAAILGTPAEAAIRKVYDDGGVLAGSSAGLACMSRVMLTGEGDFTVVRGGNVEVKEGLGYVTEAILDQHFVARQRQNRLISVVLEHPELPGIGVDEKTSIWIRPDRTFEVLGEGWVMIFDARRSVVRRDGAAGKPRLAADEIVTRILVSGDRFDLRSGTVLPRS